MTDQPAIAVRISKLAKSFGPTVALQDLSLEIRQGEVHALLGENGAGKSTLVKIMSGLSRPDHGDIHLFEEAAHIRGPKDAHRLGVQTAFQVISLINTLTVSQNMLLPYEPAGVHGLIRRRRSEEITRDVLARYGLDDIDPQREVGDLDLPTRQKLEIVRALYRDPRILLLDEPTSALSASDVLWLGDLIGKVQQSGATIVFISHRMQEVRQFCSSLTVLRNGTNVGSFQTDGISDEEIVELVIGRSLAATYPKKPPLPPDDTAPPVLSARNLEVDGALEGISLDLVAGRLHGVAGLNGMGQRELFYSLFGMVPLSAGSLEIGGQPVLLRSPGDAVKANIGISLVPEERKTEALFLEMTGRENISLPIIGGFVKGGLIQGAKESAAVRRVLDMVQVEARALYTPCKDFSGGNQQKIVLAKWLLAESRVLLLYDPTRGVDVGTKAEIYQLIRAYTDAGGAVLLYSTDVPELVNLCDDVLVIYRGREAARLEKAELSEANIMRAALGNSGSASGENAA
ncbi:MAG: sugar ABC transporter ATP-binding protein [Rhodospirillaceae bacterium]|jgi:ribose transport system ATP-binding protein|nr:sugar ABC transporter ATP-binding protein [Rhodospirillaceae bacterium]MBT3927933.1 sugar ABC transporter ATP-binding protein [Rhodospirillaceae bacterium]MBT4426164.1 sugar ABC transporter ATP-binding protein [Rhodospirillaceae bacterium]MBT5040429.1 sugar ABC transporter ATP-binding protein [Rhodospirillaceae bacterium]MBT5677659.1 sugar ABC transporter ATP-binding protein [Rhodospirillaceae bacterium]